MGEPKVHVVLRYAGKNYAFTHDDLPGYRFESDERAAEFFEQSYDDGNYSCDCNRADFIMQHCEDAPAFPLQDDGEEGLPCGDAIELVSVFFEGRDGEKRQLLPWIPTTPLQRLNAMGLIGVYDPEGASAP